MTQKRKHPPAATGGARECHRLAALDAHEITENTRKIQRHRIAFLARRFRLTHAMAAAVASLAFEGVAR